MSKKINIEMRTGRNPYSHGRMTQLVPGTGDRYPKIPKNLADQALKLLPDEIALPKVVLGDPTTAPGKLGFMQGGVQSGGVWSAIRPVAPKGPAQTDPDYLAMVSAAGEIQDCVIARQLDGVLENVFGFGRLYNGAAAGQLLGARYAGPVGDHQTVVNQLHGQVETALKTMLKKLAKRNPDRTVGELLQVAVEAIAKKVMPVVGVLDAYGEAFTQNATGRFRQELGAVNDMMEACFNLYPGLNSQSYQVGDRLLAAFAGDGLGTIPGSKGPIGLHLLLVPLDMQDWIALTLPMLAHESTHQLDDDVFAMIAKKIVTLLEFKQRAARKRMLDAYASGALKLSKQFITIGGTKIRMIDLMVKCFCGDWSGELSADLGSGLQTGGGGRIAIEHGFPAWVVRNARVADAEQIIRAEGLFVFEESEDGRTYNLMFEEHSTDWIRLEVLAAFYDYIGFKGDGAMARKMARMALGGTVPDVQTFRDETGKSDIVIELPTQDCIACAPYMMAMIDTPFLPLANKSMMEYANWDQMRQGKTDMLTDLLLAGKSQYPTDGGDIHLQYVAAAACQAFSKAVTAKRNPKQSRLDINAATYGMFDFARGLKK